jgi:multidrug transporter EmrE-like cation transporter
LRAFLVRRYLLIIPIALLVAYSQVAVKWRMNSGQLITRRGEGKLDQLVGFLSDPVILSAYAAALLGSFAWLFVLTKVPLTIAFPVYIGVTFALVMLAGSVLLAEPLTLGRVLAASLILSGIIIGVRQ